MCDRSNRKKAGRAKRCGYIATPRAGVKRKMGNVRPTLRRHIDGSRSELSARIDAMRADLAARIGERHSEIYLVRESIVAAGIWALMAHITIAAALLYVIARGFRWL